MTNGSSGPEYIPPKEERRQNREKAQSTSPGSEALSPTTGGEGVAVKPPSSTDAMTTEARGRNGVVSFDALRHD